jgi:hypothetical protein
VLYSVETQHASAAVWPRLGLAASCVLALQLLDAAAAAAAVLLSCAPDSAVERKWRKARLRWVAPRATHVSRHGCGLQRTQSGDVAATAAVATAESQGSQCYCESNCV